MGAVSADRRAHAEGSRPLGITKASSGAVRKTNIKTRIRFVPDPDGGPDILTVRGPSNTPMPLPANRYRYDVDRDGRVTVPDVLLTMKAVLGGSYTGLYGTDANGALGRNDMIAVLKAAAAS